MKLLDAYRNWNKPWPHPETGDLLKPGERITWKIMGVYRNWMTFLALQVITIVWWTHPSWFPGGLTGWNLLWSALAVAVEMVVGIAFMGQSMRDAKIIRSEVAQLREDNLLLREIHSHLVTGVQGVQDTQDAQAAADVQETREVHEIHEAVIPSGQHDGDPDGPSGADS